VLAPGTIADDFVATVRANTDQRVAAVASRSSERGRRFAERHAIDRVHSSYEALVADPGVDIVYVAAPHSEHARLGLLAIAAGKHVLIEKPIATSAAEAEEIAAAARSAGVFAGEAMWTRYLPQFDVLDGLLRRGDLGSIGWRRPTWAGRPGRTRRLASSTPPSVAAPHSTWASTGIGSRSSPSVAHGSSARSAA
jgi:predicted dehydrogenase